MTGLHSLVGDVDAFFGRHWKRDPLLHHADPGKLLTEPEVLDLIDGGLLCWPYFGLLRDGVPVPREAITTTRRFLNTTVSGFPRRSAVHEAIDQGCTLLLRQPEQWHAPIRALFARLRPAFDAELRSFLLRVASGASGRAPETEDLDLLVLHLSGEAHWTVGDRAGSTRHMTAGPGDVLYVPHHATRDVVAAEGGSLLLAVAIEEPTPQDVVDALVDGLRQRIEADDTARRHHLLPAERKAAWLRDLVLAHHAEVEADSVVRAVVGRRASGAGTSR